jgi:tellurite resistance protein TerC
MLWLWVGFLTFVFGLLAIDLGVFNRRPHDIPLKEAMLWTGVWVSLGLGFTAVVYLIYEYRWFGAHLGASASGHSGAQAALRYLTGYILEESLSVDNLFVIALICDSFGVPARHRHRLLFWGILGALIFRGAMILGGVYLVKRFVWLFYIFGAYLVFTGWRLISVKEADQHSGPHPVARWAQRFLPIGGDVTSGRFTDRNNGRFVFTPFALALLSIEAADVVFAVDSIPAILAITTDGFIVFTSNIFAILGLRSLYFVLSGMMDRFRYLKYSLAAILIFIGGKMVVHDVIDIPIWCSLAFIGLSLAAGVMFSLRSSRPSHQKMQN